MEFLVWRINFIYISEQKLGMHNFIDEKLKESKNDINKSCSLMWYF